jgi:anti-anti-sigma factor
MLLVSATHPIGLDASGNLRARLDDDAGGVRLSLAGELDLAVAPILEGLLRDITRDPQVVLILDLGELMFCDLAGLRSLRAAHAAAGGRITVVHVPPSVTRLLLVMDADDPFTVPEPGHGAPDGAARGHRVLGR